MSPRPSGWALVMLVAVLAASTAAAQPIAPANPGSSIVLVPSTEQRDLPFPARIISLSSFNILLAQGNFFPAASFQRDGARRAFGWANDPTVLGLVATFANLGSTQLTAGEQTFIVAADARFTPDGTLIELQDYFFATGSLAGTVSWISTGAPRAVIYRATPQDPFPTACCPGSTQDGYPFGYRCVERSTGMTIAASPEAAALAVSQSLPRLVHLADWTTYDGGLYFPNTHNPVPGVSAEACLACARSCGGADAGISDAGTPDAGTPDAGTPDAGTPAGACVRDSECGAGKRCASNGVCVASALGAGDAGPVWCQVDGDCAPTRQCTLGSCTPRADVFACLGEWCRGPGAGSCARQADCAVGATCKAGVCLPGTCLAPTDCPPKYVCDTQARTCRRPASPDSGVAAASQDAGSPGLFVLSGAMGGAGAASGEPILAFGGQPQPVVYEQTPINSCPRPHEVTARLCLDDEFYYSPCGARYHGAERSPAPRRSSSDPVTTQDALARYASSQHTDLSYTSGQHMELNQAAGGEDDSTLCERLISHAFRTWPKQDPRYERAAAPGCTRDAGPFAFDPNPKGGLTVAGQCGAPPPAAASESQAYAAHLATWGPLYQLDGRPLAERATPDGGFVFRLGSDIDFDRRELTFDGGTGSFSARSLRRFVPPDVVAARRAIDTREANWASGDPARAQLTSCEEYVFQRFYDYARFEEEAALLGQDDWAIWRLAFGNRRLRTSIGTRILDGTGVTDFSGAPIRDDEYGRISLAPAGAGGRYFKNEYFTPIYEADQPRTALFREALHRSGPANWAWHRQMGEALSARGLTLAEFDSFEAESLPELRRARSDYYLSWIDAVRNGRPYMPERYPPQRHAGTTLADNLTRVLFPVRAPDEFADRLSQRRTTEREQYANVGLGDVHWERAETDGLARATDRLIRVLERAEAKGYLDLSRPTPADWTPRLFAQTVKGLLASSRERAFERCVRFTGDSFDLVKARGEAAHIDFVGNATAVDAYIADVERRLARFPSVLRADGRTSTWWSAGDQWDVGALGFGVDARYSVETGAEGFYRLNVTPAQAVAGAQLGFSGDFAVGVKAFGAHMPVLEASIALHTSEPGHLPTIRSLDFDFLVPQAPVALHDVMLGDVLRPVGGLIGTFNFVRQRAEVEVASFEYTMVVFCGVPITLTGGVGGTVGAQVQAKLDRQGGLPSNLSGELKPGVNVSAFLEGGVSLLVASASIRATITLVDFSAPVSGSLSLTPVAGQSDLRLALDITAVGQLEMLDGNVSLKVCAGFWPVETCHKKKLFEWEAAVKQEFELLPPIHVAPISLWDITVAMTPENNP
jgi:hypothetical protein